MCVLLRHTPRCAVWWPPPQRERERGNATSSSVDGLDTDSPHHPRFRITRKDFPPRPATSTDGKIPPSPLALSSRRRASLRPPAAALYPFLPYLCYNTHRVERRLVLSLTFRSMEAGPCRRKPPFLCVYWCLGGAGGWMELVGAVAPLSVRGGGHVRPGEGGGGGGVGWWFKDGGRKRGLPLLDLR